MWNEGEERQTHNKPIKKEELTASLPFIKPHVTMTTVSSPGSPCVYQRKTRKRYPFCILESSQKCDTFDSLTALRCHCVQGILINKFHAGDQTNPKICCNVKLLAGNDSTILHTYQESVQSISGSVNCRRASIRIVFGLWLHCCTA